MLARGYSQEIVHEVAEQIRPFAGYGLILAPLKSNFY